MRHTAGHELGHHVLRSRQQDGRAELIPMRHPRQAAARRGETGRGVRGVVLDAAPGRTHRDAPPGDQQAGAARRTFTRSRAGWALPSQGPRATWLTYSWQIRTRRSEWAAPGAMATAGSARPCAGHARRHRDASGSSGPRHTAGACTSCRGDTLVYPGGGLPDALPPGLAVRTEQQLSLEPRAVVTVTGAMTRSCQLTVPVSGADVITVTLVPPPLRSGIDSAWRAREEPPSPHTEEP